MRESFSNSSKSHLSVIKTQSRQFTLVIEHLSKCSIVNFENSVNDDDNTDDGKKQRGGVGVVAVCGGVTGCKGKMSERGGEGAMFPSQSARASPLLFLVLGVIGIHMSVGDLRVLSKDDVATLTLRCLSSSRAMK